MVFKTRCYSNMMVLELNGRFDAHVAPMVAEWFERTATIPTPRVTVNLAGVQFIDSSALATLIQAMKRYRQQQGDVYLCNLQQSVRIIFELTQLEKAFTIFATEEEATKPV
ncbi:MAG: STAS domain-containing protein [Chloroflexi bacterium AL-W]|nr:STAS domain-containing protein [Chloroflexi bacterium AL-N1]NOK66050.1 STAS domain-containing protein [Chloroflexi bacterium AL-N10]NOK72931.1 STAS domain-containing protein [Chloroflexi bacterium AL-N5]NOK79828.1 STAS domain-containing protein [Chloroflexi bacterium AL-W]NOK88316.1 STAS domain-containing protein [Chloroflexi bacterium AL-N15]